jgi:hypothetical protein
MSIPQLRKTATSILSDKKVNGSLKDFALVLLGTTDETLMQFTLAYLNVPSDAVSTTNVASKKGKKQKKAKDPNAPKRPLNAYFEWANVERPRLQVENPKWSFEQITKELGRCWKSLDETEKKEYKDRAQERFDAWAVEKATYQASKKNDLSTSSAVIQIDDDSDDDDEEEEQAQIKETAKVFEKHAVATKSSLKSKITSKVNEDWNDVEDDDIPVPPKKVALPVKKPVKK